MLKNTPMLGTDPFYGWFVFVFHPCRVTGHKKLNQPFLLWDASVPKRQ